MNAVRQVLIYADLEFFGRDRDPSDVKGVESCWMESPLTFAAISADTLLVPDMKSRIQPFMPTNSTAESCALHYFGRFRH